MRRRRSAVRKGFSCSLPLTRTLDGLLCNASVIRTTTIAMAEPVPTTVTPTVDPKMKEQITITHVIYGMYAASLLIGISAIVGIVLNYIKRDDVAGTWLESHFRWQIRTFWYGLLWGVLGAILLLVIVGWFVLVADAIWIIYRIVKGWLYLNDGTPLPT